MGGCGADTAVPPWSPPPDALQPAAADPALLPVRVRRLSNAEYDATVAALLGTRLTPGRSFAPDKRQSGFTSNAAQRVDVVRAQQLSAAAVQLATEARARLDQLAPCEPGRGLEACAQDFIAAMGARAFRRPLAAEESARLLELYRAGAEGAAYADGIELVLRALLQSGSFLYVSELGDGERAADGAALLSDLELASELSYLITGGPPDAQLMAAAEAGALRDPEERRAQQQRLRAEDPRSREQLVRMLREWLELDRSEQTAKDIAFYPTYETYASLFVRESRDFIGAVLDGQGGDLQSLLGADWTVADAALASFYSGTDLGEGRLQLARRRGVLNQGAFLAVHAHAYESSPVLRGATIARKLLCVPVPDPTSLGIRVTAPPTDPGLTTRQRFSAHTADPSCAQCHATIDSLGDAFEAYDGMGALRETDNDAPVDSSTDLALGTELDGHYADSNALALALAASPHVSECFARYLFRAATARGPESSTAVASEEAFIARWQTLAEDRRGNVVDTLALFVDSPLFSQRRIEP